jgi:hypothetical protein
MLRTKRLLFLFTVLALSVFATTGKVEGLNCGAVSWVPTGGGLCTYSWCDGGCEAEDCVYSNGQERHYISSGCNVSQ